MALCTPEDHYIDVGGIQTRFWSLGNTGPALILLHGLGASAEIWMHNVEPLAQRHRVFVPDLPGFGRSAKPPPSFSVLDYAGFVDGFMAALGIQRASFIGQSLGGGIVLQHALHCPQRGEKLVLAACAGFGKEVIWTLRLMSVPLIGEVISYPSRIGVSLFFKLAVRNQAVITEDFIDTYYEIFNRPGHQAFLLKITRMLLDLRGGKKKLLDPIVSGLPTIKRPTLIIWGSSDRVLPVSHAYVGKDKIPHSRLCVMTRCGHVPNLERPREFNRIVLDFLAGMDNDAVA